MVTSGKRFLQTQQQLSSAVNQLTDDNTNPTIKIPTLDLQSKIQTPVPESVQKIVQNQPGNPTGSISAPDKSNTQLWLEYQKQKISDKASELKQDIKDNAQSLAESFGPFVQDIGAEVEAAAATKFALNAEEVKERAETQASLTKRENEKAQENKSAVESKFGRMVGDTSKLQEPFQLKLGFNPSPFKVGYLNSRGNEVSLTSGTSSITKPIIKTIDYSNVLGQAYDTVTYKAANEKVIMSVEDFDELFPEYADVPYDQKQLFINECIYDVQQGKKRDINEYADFFGSMSMKEGYVNQQDATIEYLTDPDIAKYSLGAFTEGLKTLDGRTPQEIKDYVEAAYVIKAYADEINNRGYNLTESAGWTIVKSFADMKGFEDLKAAIKTFEDFNMTTTEAYQINNTYEQNLRTQNELINAYVYGDKIQQHDALKEFTDQYLYQFHKDYINSFIKEVAEEYQKDMEGPLKSSDWNEFLMWLYQDYYEVDGKRYNKDGEEILHSEGRDGFLNRVADGFIMLASDVETLGFDTTIAQQTWNTDSDLTYKWERTMDALFDTVNVTFGALMEFTPGGQLFQFATTLGRAGAAVDWLFMKTMEGLGRLAEGMGDMIGFTDGWGEDSKEKYKRAMEGIGIMLLGQLKNKIVRRGKAEMTKYLDETAIMKSLRAYVDELAKGAEIKDGTKIKEAIEERAGIDKTGKPKTRKEVEEQRKAEQKAATKETEKTTTDTTEKKNGIVTLKKGTQEQALRTFREIFDEEIKKVNEQGETPKLLDTLFQAAAKITDTIFNSRTKETEKPTGTAETKETAPVEGKAEATKITEDIVTEKPEQPAEVTTEQAKIETAPEAPGVKVEEASTKAPEGTAEGTAETESEKNVEEAKSTVNLILDFMQKVQDNAKEMISEYRKAKEEKKSKKEREEMEDYFTDPKGENLTEKDIKVMEENPFTETILRIVDNYTQIKKGKKGEIVQGTEDLPNNSDIQKEVLSEGIMQMQKFLDRINQLKKELGILYQQLSKKATMKSEDFLNSEPFNKMLEDAGFKYNEWIDDKLNIHREIVADDGRVLSAKDRAVKKYLESMIDIITEKRMISEQDAHNIRTNFTSEGDRDKSGDFPAAMKRTLYNSWNEFLNEQGASEVLRMIDKGYMGLEENLNLLSEVSKKGQMKETAKNKILNWDKETIDQMEELMPGISKLIELSKISPKLVKKVYDAKIRRMETNKALSNWGRYSFVMLASAIAGMIPGGLLIKSTVGSLAFVLLERTGVKLKKKLSKDKIDREAYNKYVDTLKVDGNEKAKLKQDELKRYEELNKIREGETEASIQKIIDDATQILIERKANEIKERKQEEKRETERKQQKDNKKQEVKEPEYTEQEKVIIESALPAEEINHSEKAEKMADIIEESITETSKAAEKSAENTLIEKGEDLTEENIQKEMNAETPSILDFLAEMNSGEDTKKDTDTPDYRKTDLDTLMEIAEHPEKYPNVDIDAVNDAIEYIIQKNTMAEAREGGGMRGSDINMELTFAAEVDRVNGMEQRVSEAKTPEAKEKLRKEWEKAKEDVIEEIQQAYNIDQFEAADKFDSLSNASLKTIEEGQRTKKGYKGKHRVVKAEQDKLLALMGKGPSQNITYTSSSENIATMENPASRKRVAEQRIRQVVDPKLEKAKIGTNKAKIARNTAKRESEKEALNKIIEVANEELKAREEKENQKKELAQDYKDLETKRAATPYKETKKEITKKMDKISDEFDKLTEEEFADTYEKPKEVVEEEANEQAGKDEFNKAMDENETPQKTETEVEKKYVEPVETFYHASDTAIDTFDLSKTKPDQNGIGLAVNTKSENAYKDKPNQYEFDGKDFKIAPKDTTLSKEEINSISEKLGIDPNEMRDRVELPELSAIIAEESGKGNKEVLDVLVEETGYDGVETSHDYTLLRNEEKINKSRRNNKPDTKEGEEPEPTIPKKPTPKYPEPSGEKVEEEKEEPGSKPLVTVERDGTVYKEPMVGDIKTEEIYARMEAIRKKVKETGKLTQAESVEFNLLKDLYKRQLEWEAREKQAEMSEEELDNMYERMYTNGPVSTAGIDMSPYTD